MKRTLVTAALASLIIGSAAQAGSLTNQEVYATFGEESYLSDHAIKSVDMASMEIRSERSLTPEHGISISAVHEIFGEERVAQPLPQVDMAAMQVTGSHTSSPFIRNNEAYSILDIDV